MDRGDNRGSVVARTMTSVRPLRIPRATAGRWPRRIRASPVAMELMRSFDLMDAATCCVLLFCGVGIAVVDLAHRSAWEERERRGYSADSESDDDA